jgi:hypothetical protein
LTPLLLLYHAVVVAAVAELHRQKNPAHLEAHWKPEQAAEEVACRCFPCQVSVEVE